MKKTFNACLIFGTFLLLFAANAWSTTIPLPSVGDTVEMHQDWGYNYGMKITESTNGSTIGDTYNAFCVEKYEYFSDGGSYWVESVGTVATGGGGGAFLQTAGIWAGKSGDPISAESIWLYASFFDGLFGGKNQALVTKVQNAIWYVENEVGSLITDWEYLSTYNNTTSYEVTGWNIQVVNLISYNNGATINNQSQLVGVRATAHTPEPATMILFGFGLLGIARVSRNKLMK